jgi:hypothetical protein
MRPPPATPPAGEATAPPAGSLYIDPTEAGNDAATGTVTAPLRTIAKALTLALLPPYGRPKAPRVLVLRKGTHYLLDTLQITPALSGLRIRAYPAESPIISGGTPLQLTFQPAQQGDPFRRGRDGDGDGDRDGRDDDGDADGDGDASAHTTAWWASGSANIMVAELPSNIPHRVWTELFVQDGSDNPLNIDNLGSGEGCGARVSTENYTQGCHWFARLFV